MWTYSPVDVDASILGIDVEGFSSDTFINITPDNPTFTYRRAMDGSTVATMNRYSTYTVTLTLHQSSPANTWLHLLYGIFKEQGIQFIMPVLIKDKSGTTSFFATDCWFDLEPSTTFSNKVENTEWRIKCNNGTYVKGGNGDDSIVTEVIQAVQTALSLAGTLGIDLGNFENILNANVDTALQSLGGIL